MDYTKTSLFQGVTQDEFQSMCSCFQARMVSYHAGESICNDPEKMQAVGILEEGRAVLVRIDAAGNRTILEYLSPGSVFGEMTAFCHVQDSIFLECQQNCRVLYIDYDQLTKRCENACRHHTIVVENMLHLMSEKALRLSRRVEVLSSRSIRCKLLCYFHQQLPSPDSHTLVLPFSLSALADYISTDRSAMMRELKKLREEGFIRMEGRKVTLLNDRKNSYFLQ